jgi:hypothetical protein
MMGMVLCLVPMVMSYCTIETRASPELVALRDIMNVHKAEAEFHSTRGRYGSLQELGPDGASLISRELARGVHHSYKFSLSPTETRYVVRARPLQWGKDAWRCFYSDETRIVRQNRTNNEATAQSERVY